MASYSKITLIGYAAKDPDIRNVSSDKKVAEISIPINESYTDRSGKSVENTAWYRVSFWNQKADVIEKYVKKGSQLHIEGRLTVRNYTDKEGKERYSLDVLAQDFTLLGGRPNEGEGGGSSYANNASTSSYGNRSENKSLEPSLQSTDNDDLPF